MHESYRQTFVCPPSFYEGSTTYLNHWIGIFKVGLLLSSRHCQEEYFCWSEKRPEKSTKIMTFSMAAITLNFTEAILVQFWGLYCPEHTSGQIHKYSCLTFFVSWWSAALLQIYDGATACCAAPWENANTILSFDALSVRCTKQQKREKEKQTEKNIHKAVCVSVKYVSCKVYVFCE